MHAGREGGAAQLEFIADRGRDRVLTRFHLRQVIEHLGGNGQHGSQLLPHQLLWRRSHHSRKGNVASDDTVVTINDGHTVIDGVERVFPLALGSLHQGEKPATLQLTADATKGELHDPLLLERQAFLLVQQAKSQLGTGRAQRIRCHLTLPPLT